MTNLDKRLEQEISKARMVYTGMMQPDIEATNKELRDAIKQAFKEAGWIAPEQVKQVQELVNQMANLAQDMAKLPVTVREVDTMSGEEWYGRFKEWLPEPTIMDWGYKCLYASEVERAAKKASGIET